MTLQSSGAISLNDIHIEAGGSSGTQAGINDSDIRGLISKSSGSQMAFNEWYGASNIPPYTPVLLNTYSSALTSQPSWIDVIGTKSSSYRGFISTGMYITGNSSGSATYPMTTRIPELSNGTGAYGSQGSGYYRKAVLTCKIYKNHVCADHAFGIAKVGYWPGGQIGGQYIYPAWYQLNQYNFWGANSARIVPIAWNCSSPTYFPYTGSWSWSGYGSPSYMTSYSYWMGVRITFIPNVSCQLEMFGNNWTSASSVSFSTSYRRYNTTHTNSGMTDIGSLSTPTSYTSSNGGYQFIFDADQDSTSYRSYFKDLEIKVYG